MNILKGITLTILTLIGTYAHSTGVNVDDKRITVSLNGEPPSLDSALAEDSDSYFLLRQVKEGLVRADARGKIVPGVATHWDVHDKGATFYLNPNAKWSDGKPVTAHDFEFAWRRVATPATGASGSTFMYFVLENAQDIIAGKKPPEALGVRAIDDLTLEVTTSQFVPYLVETLAGSPWLPQRRDMVEKYGDEYASKVDKQLYNGPFQLVEWVHGAKVVLTKNPTYWNTKDIELNGIDFGYITTDQRALFNLFQSGEIATLAINNSILKDVSDAGVRLRKRPNHCYRQLTLNLRPERATGNKALRQALLHAFDPETYVNRIIAMPGTTRLESLYPDEILSHEGVSFSKTFASSLPGSDIPKAKEFLAQAEQEMGELPNLVLLSREGNEKQDEFIQALYKRELGLNVQIDRQSFKQAIEKLIQGEFDIAFSGFCNGIMTDPYLVARTYESTNPFNDGRFNSPRFDDLLKASTTQTDPVKRMQIFTELEQILFEAAAVIPTMQTSDLYVQDDRLRRIAYGPTRDFSRGVVRN